MANFIQINTTHIDDEAVFELLKKLLRETEDVVGFTVYASMYQYPPMVEIIEVDI
jgi:hypothetical protein